MAEGNLPTKALVLTFDDGYQDNFINALPVLEKHRCAATFFIASKGIEQGYLWNDQVQQLIIATEAEKISKEITGVVLPLHSKQEKIQSFNALITYLKFLDQNTRTMKIKLLEDELGAVIYKRTMMTASQVKQLTDKGFMLGAHTHNHTILSTETKQVTIDELQTNKVYLETLTRKEIDSIAFPNGLYNRDYNKEHCGAAKQLKFRFGFSTNDGGAFQHTPKFALPRFMPFRRNLSLFSLSIAKIASENG
ncbi:polysaccharide deacetylase family protein [Thalassotalea nanhaiensis]|uniref:Polysaccharide deacetylase family protein n=1 Tax=Thalassotalea nanhaiensis TaxID=3065648 RepID=A0ABY9TL06_9GAMM|nr:polysaccharide deacetylase family protein [Colwelliaceae bacterium SQ345]